jgi:hypothetical protein
MKNENILYEKSTLSFTRRLLKKSTGLVSEDRTYIDFLIDGVSLATLLGETCDTVGKFGWKGEYNFGLSELNFLRSTFSRTENGYISIYVCPECGNEACGAVMMQIKEEQDCIIWSDFIWSDGWSEIMPEDRYTMPPIVFDRTNYHLALNELETMLRGQCNKI